ncbi:hypothetical protein D9M68_878840 [compost metagenome]
MIQAPVIKLLIHEVGHLLIFGVKKIYPAMVCGDPYPSFLVLGQAHHCIIVQAGAGRVNREMYGGQRKIRPPIHA